MAVYTEVGFDEADRLVRRLGLGALTELRGIRSGIENTNYYATTARGQWVLTLFERLTREQLPYYLRLMEHLAREVEAVLKDTDTLVQFERLGVQPEFAGPAALDIRIRQETPLWERFIRDSAIQPAPLLLR